MIERVFQAGGFLSGSSAAALESVLRRQPGVHHVTANPLSNTITVGYDEATIAADEILRVIRDCGYHCAGEVLPRHVCAPRRR